MHPIVQIGIVLMVIGIIALIAFTPISEGEDHYW